jgi:predicted DNA-binding transcriptional regulator AlpA
MFDPGALVPELIAERVLPELALQAGDRWLTMQETAAFFSVSQNTIRNWMRDGVVSPRRIHGSVIRFSLRELQAVVERAPRR